MTRETESRSRRHENADLEWLVLQLRSIAGFHFPEQPDGEILKEAAVRLEKASRSETRDNNPWTFRLDDQQAAKLEAWCAEQDKAVLEKQRAAGADDQFIAMVHEAGQPYYGAIGGELTFLFSPNSIGEVQRVRHSGTGSEIDLTDYNW